MYRLELDGTDATEMAGLAVGLLINTFPGVSDGPSESAVHSGS